MLINSAISHQTTSKTPWIHQQGITMYLLTSVCVVLLATVSEVSAQCNEGCLNAACNSAGECTDGCKPNYVGDKCDTCSPSGAFWNEEFQQCHSCPRKCSKCESLTNCTECLVDGTYGDTCESGCGYGCKQGRCDKDTGACACNNGYAPDKCDTCADGFYLDGYECKACTGDCVTCMLDWETVVCESCSTGMYGESCETPCPGGCAANKCEMNGTCSAGCTGGFEGPSCDTCVAGKWGAGCDQNCPATCTACTSNTACTACDTGYYGDACPTACPANCDGDCDKATGACAACNTGYYGDACATACPANCDGDCDKTTGACAACKDGYSGDLCCLQNDNCETCSSTTECSACTDGFHGATCEGICPQNCKSCSGADDCGSNCMGGYYGVVCDQDCPENCAVCGSETACSTCAAGFFGATCGEECADNCMDNTCQKISGNCLACEEGYRGDKCDEVSAGNRVADIGVWMLLLPMVIALLNM